MKSLIEYLVIQFSKFSFIEEKQDKNSKKIIDLYNEGGFMSSFVKMRFWDGPLSEVESKLSKNGTILDIGCGEGILSNYIAISSPKRKLLGIEINKRRVKKAQKGLKNTRFVYGNILTYKIPVVDSYVISDVLHHLPSLKDQENLLKVIYKKMGKNDRLIIAEIDKGISLKYLLCFLVDAFVVPILFEKKLYDFSFIHRSKKDWLKVLKEIGFSVKVFSGEADRPFPDVIFQCAK